ncbi:MAG TPA: hypothetical protein VIM12_13365 [Noviherbaspirillum sp.]|uniref:hypothetical protein n=1 Tax=Noviherbaspirillum sp. TaxID=1926288 RepID=UPI002F95F12E
MANAIVGAAGGNGIATAGEYILKAGETYIVRKAHDAYALQRIFYAISQTFNSFLEQQAGK